MNIDLWRWEGGLSVISSCIPQKEHTTVRAHTHNGRCTCHEHESVWVTPKEPLISHRIQAGKNHRSSWSSPRCWMSTLKLEHSSSRFNVQRSFCMNHFYTDNTLFCHSLTVNQPLSSAASWESRSLSQNQDYVICCNIAFMFGCTSEGLIFFLQFCFKDCQSKTLTPTIANKSAQKEHERTFPLCAKKHWDTGQVTFLCWTAKSPQ